MTYTVLNLDHLFCSKIDSVLGTLVEKGKVREVSSQQQEVSYNTLCTLPFLPEGHNPLFGEPLFGVMFLKENIRGLCMSIYWEHLVKTNLVETFYKNVAIERCLQ